MGKPIASAPNSVGLSMPSKESGILRRIQPLSIYSLQVLPLLTFLSAATFYYALFHQWNSGSVFDEEIVERSPTTQLDYSVDICRTSLTKIQIRAWIVQKGHSPRNPNTLLLVRAPNSAQYVRVKTRIELRPDVSEMLNQKYSDDLDYSASGLVGSLNFAHTHYNIERGRVYAAYDTGSGYLIASLPCSF